MNCLIVVIELSRRFRAADNRDPAIRTSGSATDDWRPKELHARPAVLPRHLSRLFAGRDTPGRAASQHRNNDALPPRFRREYDVCAARKLRLKGTLDCSHDEVPGATPTSRQ